MRSGESRRRASRRLPLLAALAAAALALAGCQASGPAQAGAGYVAGDGTVTTWAPAQRTGPVTLQGVDLVGKELSTAAMAGDVIVVNFWQSACPPCRAEAGDLAALAKEFADRDVRFVGVNSTDDAATAQAFERTYQPGYPTLLDTSSQATAALQGVVALKAVPTTIVLDRGGKVAGRIVGRIDPATLRTMIAGVAGEEQTNAAGEEP